MRPASYLCRPLEVDNLTENEVWIILFIIPLLHFAILLILLESIDIRFDMTISGQIFGHSLYPELYM